MTMRTMKGGVTAPAGFLAAGIYSGIKPTSNFDLALVVSEQEGPIAGVFTTNCLAAAPILVDRLHLKHKTGQAIIINSGNANACTGAQGLADAEEMATLVANRINASCHAVFVGSTGVIGIPLPMPVIRRGIPQLMQRLRRTGNRDAARAIMTTDSKPKEAAGHIRLGGRTVTIGGMAKGSGMIHPDMATMLAYLTTDAAIDPQALQKTLVAAVEQSFHCISVDGDTSTNDTVLCLANGTAGNPILKQNSTELQTFQQLLNEVCQSLALQICRDGEGATKIVHITVKGARTHREAKDIARTIATSSLVKTAFFGEDPNWGRIMMAIGRSGVPVDPQATSLAFDKIPIVKKGIGLGPTAEKHIKQIMRRKEFNLTATVGSGPGFFRLWTTDLSYDYVKINASYRS